MIDQTQFPFADIGKKSFSTGWKIFTGIAILASLAGLYYHSNRRKEDESNNQSN
jgi:hypothetical protein